LFAQLTCVTATLSLAVPPSDMGLDVAVYVPPLAGLTIATVGGVGSEVTVSTAVAELFAASRAAIVITFAPGCSAIAAAVQLLVPVAVPEPPRSFTHVTCVTPILSAAVPPNVSDVVFVAYVGVETGLVMLTVGAVVSGPLGPIAVFMST
jgi:hypothetical protein